RTALTAVGGECDQQRVDAARLRTLGAHGLREPCRLRLGLREHVRREPRLVCQCKDGCRLVRAMRESNAPPQRRERAAGAVATRESEIEEGGQAQFLTPMSSNTISRNGKLCRPLFSFQCSRWRDLRVASANALRRLPVPRP